MRGVAEFFPKSTTPPTIDGVYGAEGILLHPKLGVCVIKGCNGGRDFGDQRIDAVNTLILLLTFRKNTNPSSRENATAFVPSSSDGE